MNSKSKKFLFIGVDQAIPYLLDKYIDEGVLPNLKSLAEGGIQGKGLSCPPCDTPTNWTTLATGATTAIHGVTSFYAHFPGEPLALGMQHRSRTQLSKYCEAEYLWSVADKKNLKPFVINYPSGWPPHFDNGAMGVFYWPIPEAKPIKISGGASHTYKIKSEQEKFQIIESSKKIENIESELPLLKITIKLDYGNITEPKLIDIYLLGKDSEYKRIAVKDSKSGDWVYGEQSQWSNWISVVLETKFGKLSCLYRIKIKELVKNGSKLVIERSAVYNTQGWTEPENLGDKIIRNVDIHQPPKEHEVEYMIEGEVEPYLLYARKEATSIAQAVKFAKQEIDWKTAWFHIHFLDSVNHKSLAQLYPESAIYDPEKTEQTESNVKTAYMIIDEMVGDLLSSCVDDETTVLFISDHGAIPAWKIVNISKVLEDAGLISYKWIPEKKRYVVDWKETSAFPYLEPPYVWVNKKGRDPDGIISEAQYEKVRDDIIEALMNIKDPENGAKVIHKALRKEDAEELGQNGKRIGDVIYFLNPPYQIFDGNLDQLDASSISRRHKKLPIVYDAKGCFGAHAYYLPETTFGNFSISVPYIINGPGLQKGINLQEPINLIDIAPTMAHILGIPSPVDAQGRVIYDFMI